jgi:hypothetical protein
MTSRCWYGHWHGNGKDGRKLIRLPPLYFLLASAFPDAARDAHFLLASAFPDAARDAQGR